MWDVALMGDRSSAYIVLVGRSEGKRPLSRPRRRWEDNTRMDFQDVRWVGLVPGQGQVVGTCKCSNEPFRFHKDGEFLD